MIRFAWLQARTQTSVVFAGLAVLVVAALVTGIHLTHLYDTLVKPCQGDQSCGIAIGLFSSHDAFMQTTFSLLARMVPALLGVFWGAPLIARELENGTHRLAWTQSVTRARWTVTKLGMVGLATTVVAGVFAVTITRWFSKLDTVGSNQYAIFDSRDLVPVGYAVFAFALGALAGAVVRRAVPAMAITLAAYIAVRVLVTTWVRPHLLKPLHSSLSILNARDFGFLLSPTGLRLVAKGDAPHNAWTLSSHIVTSSGAVASRAQLTDFLHSSCPAIAQAPGGGPGVTKAPDPAAFEACRQQAAKVFHLLVTYQPASRYWTFQWLESGIYLLLALAALAGTFWWVTRRIS